MSSREMNKIQFKIIHSTYHFSGGKLDVTSIQLRWASKSPYRGFIPCPECGFNAADSRIFFFFFIQKNCSEKQ